MLSTFESALLDRHLRGCPDCRSFASGAEQQTLMLRAAALEQPTRPVSLPSGPQRAVPRRIVGVLSACLVASAAAAVLVWPGARTGGSGQETLGSRSRIGAPVMVVVPAHPTTNVNVVVPRLRLKPASVADGPVHGYFGAQV